MPVGVPGPRAVAEGPFWWHPEWIAATRNPAGADFAELAAADLPDVGWAGDPEHRLWRVSPYGPALRPKGACRWPRPDRALSWGPAVVLDRGTPARAALWQPPGDPG